MELKAKQDYLFREIIEDNYDPEAFQDYIQQFKGANLESYTFDELKSIVQKFKGNQKQQENTKNLQSEIKSQAQSFVQTGNLQNASQFEKNKNQTQMKQYLEKQSNNYKKNDSFNTSTKTYHQLLKKQSTSKLFKRINQNNQNVHIKIRSYSKEIGQSLLSRTYVLFLLQTSVGWSVKRRFKDFLWLHTKLTAMYPGFPIPPIPKKTAIPSLQDKHLEERMIIFQNFANRLLHIPQICSDQILQQFLSVGNSEQFQNCKQRYQIKLSNNKHKIISLKGDKLINMSVSGIDKNQTKFHQISYQIIKDLNSQLYSFQKLLRQVSQKAFELSSTFSQAYKHFECNKVNKCQILELMGDFVSELGYRLDSQYYFVKDHLQEYWSYQEKYQQNLINHIVKINKQQEDIMYKSKNNSINQQEIDIEESYSKNKSIQEYLSSKQLYRIKLSFLMDQLERHKSYDFGIIAKEWVLALQSYVGGIKDLMLSGADQLTKGMCIVQGKKLVEVEYMSKQRGSKDNNPSYR